MESLIRKKVNKGEKGIKKRAHRSVRHLLQHNSSSFLQQHRSIKQSTAQIKEQLFLPAEATAPAFLNCYEYQNNAIMKTKKP